MSQVYSYHKFWSYENGLPRHVLSQAPGEVYSVGSCKQITAADIDLVFTHTLELRFKPDVDANDDYLVLKEVQLTWDTPEIPAVVDGCRFMTELAEIYKERTRCKTAMQFALHCSLYQVGDYARAALKVKQAEQAQI